MPETVSREEFDALKQEHDALKRHVERHIVWVHHVARSVARSGVLHLPEHALEPDGVR
jgi:hypothetical protein